MSEFDELVSGLRERAEHAATEGNMTATCDARYFAQSADTIQALQFEVERLKGVLGEEERACEKAIITATKAEYEAAKLKEALTKIMDLIGSNDWGTPTSALRRIIELARRALGEGK